MSPAHHVALISHGGGIPGLEGDGVGGRLARGSGSPTKRTTTGTRLQDFPAYSRAWPKNANISATILPQ